jgi:hypothetical protein
MTTKEFIDSLFKDYDQTPALSEFKEELQSNLDEKIASLVKKGMTNDEAFKKATAELGDISALADEISLKKKQEVFEERYMDVRTYMKAPRVVGYIIFGVTFLFGILVGLIVYFSTSGYDIAPHLPEYFRAQMPEGMRNDLAGVFASLLPFITAAIAGFTFLGLTQETASLEPMKKKRATLYAVGSGLIVFGIILFPVVYFGGGKRYGMIGALGTLIPFVLSGIGLLAFLMLTEKDRRKPWVISHYAEDVKKSLEMFSDPVTATRFGLFSGAIWIFAFGLFFLLGFTVGFKFSWMVFVFAIAAELLVQAFLCKPSVPPAKT